ncbi:MAG: hypothetical protein ABSC11_08260, partial [Smithella sp.]
MQNKLKFFIPSIADVIFFLLFMFLALRVPSILLVDCDTGLHIKIGEFVLNTFSVPNYDIFFATTPPLQYIAYEWLSQVIMAFVYHHLDGLTGIVIFFSFLIAFTYYLLFRILKKENGNTIITTCVALLVICASSVLWQAKPHIFSILIFIAWYYILDLYQYKNKNYIYALPALMLLWVNLHGAFILGFVLCGIYFLGNIVQVFLIKETQQVIYKAKAKKLIFIMSLLIIVSLCNPSGLKGLMQPFTVLSNSVLKNNIDAYLSPNFHNIDIIPFEILLLFMIIKFAFSKRKQSIIEILLTVLFTSMALYSVRNISFFAIVMAPILIRHSDPIPSRRESIIEILLTVLFAVMALYAAGFLFFAIIMAPILIWQSRKILTGNNVILIDSQDTGNQNVSEINLSAKDFFWLLLPVIFVQGLVMTGHIKHQFNERINPVAAVEFLKKEH